MSTDARMIPAFALSSQTTIRARQMVLGKNYSAETTDGSMDGLVGGT